MKLLRSLVAVAFAGLLTDGVRVGEDELVASTMSARSNASDAELFKHTIPGMALIGSAWNAAKSIYYDPPDMSKIEMADFSDLKEAIGSLLKAIQWARKDMSKTFLLCKMTDPSLFPRLVWKYSTEYAEWLDRLTAIDTKSANNLGSKSVFNPDNILDVGWLRYAAMASLFARAAYGVVNEDNNGDGVATFVLGSAKNSLGYADGMRNNDAFVKAAGADKEDLIHSHWAEEIYHPAYALLKVPALKWLVISIRGTQGLNGALTDLMLDECEVNAGKPSGGKTFCGFIEAGRWLRGEVQRHGEPFLARNPDYKLVVTGHSLGAATTAMLTYLLREGDSEHGDGEPRRLTANAVGYGIAPVSMFSPKMADAMESYFISVTNDIDIVTRINVAGVGNLFQDIADSSFTIGCSLTEWLPGKANNIEKEWTPMALPGRIVHINNRGVGFTKADPPQLFFTPAEFYSKVYNGPFLVHDHLAGQYTGGLLAAMQDNEARPEDFDDLDGDGDGAVDRALPATGPIQFEAYSENNQQEKKIRGGLLSNMAPAATTHRADPKALWNKGFSFARMGGAAEIAELGTNPQVLPSKGNTPHGAKGSKGNTANGAKPKVSSLLELGQGASLSLEEQLKSLGGAAVRASIMEGVEFSHAF